MEALIPKLFILSAEASIVLFLILIVMLILNSKAKRKDFSAAREMIGHFIKNKDKRITDLKTQLDEIGFNNNADEQAEKLYEQEKSLIKEFVSLYLQHDSARLLKYPRNITNVDNEFLKTSGTAANTAPAEPIKDTSEENANATSIAREQAESNDEQLKELSELRLKNTELNEHLFEALETITELMTEHGKKTGQDIDTNSQKVLEAIIYLRDKRLRKEQDSSSIEAPEAVEPNQEPEDDTTLDISTTVDLGFNDDVEADLDAITDSEEEDPWAEAESETSIEEDIPTLQVEEETEVNQPEVDSTNADEIEVEETEEDDPWADALAEQAAAEVEEDPWAEALAEQDEAENKP